MPSLDPALRNELEKAVVRARDEAENASSAALSILAVNRPKAFAALTKEQRAHRNALRAKARQLAGGSQSAGFSMLVEEVAYAQWHRMLFARYLAENNLLMHPEKRVPVTLEECEELATVEGDQDRWMTAARYAGVMLPGISSPDDPAGDVSFAPEGRASLEAILEVLPKSVFTSDDGLGWAYQFWQSKKKREVSSSGKKIEKLDLAAYSQLFTEDYMVRFLLENSLGAWWAVRHPDSEMIRDFKYLRFRDDGIPAAGTFPGWPERAADVTVIDPCCGSGHFLVVAFDMLRQMRMEEEGLSEADSADAVIRDNLFGLEIDPRCVQIAAFSLALAAWKVGGYRSLPLPNVACSGIPVSGQLEAWTRLAGDDPDMQQTLERLHGLFLNAPGLGSLIDPADVPARERLFSPDYARVAPLLESLLARERADDPVAAVFGSTALGVARAAALLGREYTLVATNVPYLARGKQGDELKDFIELHHEEAKADLATAFLGRCRSFCLPGGAYGVVTPQNWLFLGSYRKLREQVLREQTWCLVARLGERAFESNAAAGAFVALLLLENRPPPVGHRLEGWDVSGARIASDKANLLCHGNSLTTLQRSQLSNPDARVSLAAIDTSSLLAHFADSLQGTTTGDNPRFVLRFWELPRLDADWEPLQTSVDATTPYGGRENIVYWQRGRGVLASSSQARVQGTAAFHKSGVAVRQMRHLPCTLYTGEMFDMNCAILVPKNPIHLPAIWAYCSSSEFNSRVRVIDSKVNVTNATLAKVPFDLDYWRKAAEESGPLPEPYSGDVTQWLFQGDPLDSTEPLQAAVGRLLGYHWPQGDLDHLSPLGIEDGILPLSSVSGHEPASERLRRVLAAAYGEKWSAERQTELLRHVRFAEKGMGAWLRDSFFAQHCSLFHQRPFIWHIWDGRRDGFSVLVNYHKLDFANLNKLIYTYLGEWVRTQRAAQDSATPGADARLVAALELQKKLEAIRDGEKPYDIYVRWKPLHEQPIGWNPDLNDGVRLNIRPFVKAGILRSRVNVRWNKDRGRNLDGSDRVNDLHHTLAEKRAAREAATA